MEVGNFIFASGQIPVDPATGEVPEGITAQAEQSCKNVGAILAAAGLDYTNVVKTTCFLADMADFAAFNEVYAKYFTRSICQILYRQTGTQLRSGKSNPQRRALRD